MSKHTPGGWGSIFYSLKMSQRGGGLWSMIRALYSKNSCKTCALGMGGQYGGLKNERGKFPEVCNKSFQAQASDMQGALSPDFFESNSIDSLKNWTPHELELSGRLTKPIICDPLGSHYRQISWEEAFDQIAKKLNQTDPSRSYFYASGRSSNEAGFLLQLFARIFGTNNLNNCSYYCHQASGVGMTQSLGTGTATIQLEDLNRTDCLFLIGANPSSNHPRFMRILMDIRRRGGKVIVINPVREPGLERFSIPSDWKSLLFGSDISSTYIQPHVGGDGSLLKGISKALLQLATQRPEVLAREFILQSTEHFESFKDELNGTSWQNLEEETGLTQNVMENLAVIYSNAKNAVFAWAMGITHHAHGVSNVHEIVNLALLRGMVGQNHAGLLPLRGHSNVQGIGSIGFTPQLKNKVLQNLESYYGVTFPKSLGLDTLACMETADAGNIDFAWHLGGNLYASNPDSKFTERAFSKIDFVLYLNTTLNQGHFRGRGKKTLILPVMARDEEPQPTTQESMFSFVRMSEGGLKRYSGPRSEIDIIVTVGSKVLPNQPIAWQEMTSTANVRKVIGSVVPGFELMKDIDKTRKEFHVGNRKLDSLQFPTLSGKAKFLTGAVPSLKQYRKHSQQFILTTVRSEGQFNTVVFDEFDRYRGANSRNVVFISDEDLKRLRWSLSDRVIVKNKTGQISGQILHSFPIKPGNVMMYYPEANILVPKTIDEYSKTPAFKSVAVEIIKE